MNSLSPCKNIKIDEVQMLKDLNIYLILKNEKVVHLIFNFKNYDELQSIVKKDFVNSKTIQFLNCKFRIFKNGHVVAYCKDLSCFFPAHKLLLTNI